MNIPPFVKEIIWSFYPPRYKQLSEQSFSSSLVFIGKVLCIAMLISSVFFIPKLLFLNDDIKSELSKFSEFSVFVSGVQSDRVSIPSSNPLVVVDFNSNLSLTNEIFVVDSDSVKYRFFGVKSIPREQLLNPVENKDIFSRFSAVMLILLLPGIVLFLFVRMWLKYVLLTLVFGSFFFIFAELTKFRLRWKQMLNVSAHALVPVIFLEVVSAGIFSAFLLPLKLRFLGVKFYAVSLLILAVFIVMGIIGSHIGDKHKK